MGKFKSFRSGFRVVIGNCCSYMLYGGCAAFGVMTGIRLANRYSNLEKKLEKQAIDSLKTTVKRQKEQLDYIREITEEFKNDHPELFDDKKEEKA